MEENENILNLDKEFLESLSADELVDLKIELNDMLQEVQDLIDECDEVL